MQTSNSMQANKDYFIMINNEAEYNQAVKMLQYMGFKSYTVNTYNENINIVYTYDRRAIGKMSGSRETYKKEFPDDIELLINNESKEITTTKHNINIAEHPELYNVIVLTRTKEEWDDVIQYDPNSGLESRHFDNYQENSIIYCEELAFCFGNLKGIRRSGGDYDVIYYSQWKALLERLAAEQKENDKYLFANKEMKQFKDLSDSEKLIIVNALINNLSKVSHYNIQTKIWEDKFHNDIYMNSVYRVLK